MCPSSTELTFTGGSAGPFHPVPCFLGRPAHRAVVPRNGDGSEGRVKAAAGDTRPKKGAPLAPTNRVGGTPWDQ